MNAECNFHFSYVRNRFDLYNGKLPSNITAFGYTTITFWIFISEKWIERPSQCKATGVAEEITDGKIAATLVKGKRVQIPVFHGTGLQIQDKVRSIIKAKIHSENNTQDTEELLPGN